MKNEKYYVELMRINEVIEKYDRKNTCDCAECQTIRKAFNVYRNYCRIFSESDQTVIKRMLEECF